MVPIYWLWIYFVVCSKGFGGIGEGRQREVVFDDSQGRDPTPGTTDVQFRRVWIVDGLERGSSCPAAAWNAPCSFFQKAGSLACLDPKTSCLIQTTSRSAPRGIPVLQSGSAPELRCGRFFHHRPDDDMIRSRSRGWPALSDAVLEGPFNEPDGSGRALAFPGRMPPISSPESDASGGTCTGVVA